MAVSSERGVPARVCAGRHHPWLRRPLRCRASARLFHRWRCVGRMLVGDLVNAPFATRVVEAVGAAAVEGEEQEDEGEKRGRLAAVLYRPEALREMRHEIGDRHLAGHDERDWPGEQSD